MFGQIATYMDTLHLTYTEVWGTIPIRNLILMQKDKLHEATGDIVKETTGREIFERRGGK